MCVSHTHSCHQLSVMMCAYLSQGINGTDGIDGLDGIPGRPGQRGPKGEMVGMLCSLSLNLICCVLCRGHKECQVVMVRMELKDG